MCQEFRAFGLLGLGRDPRNTTYIHMMANNIHMMAKPVKLLGGRPGVFFHVDAEHFDRLGWPQEFEWGSGFRV